ncbi:hypothetical protein RHGRI_025690 [Rhododendron griersonianum]|uniref:Uncharacterized protein n=1 Tax=Rhododendron griersonianum TaxID=479676 RepID=A0AAV6ISB7_9ERIC|nr:hypothetical protein RHGRI_025690 [Rhododendron griersonianum]
MAQQAVRDDRYAVAEDVNEGDEAVRGAQLGERFQQIKDTHEALVKRATLIVDNQPHYYPLNLCSFMEEGFKKTNDYNTLFSDTFLILGVPNDIHAVGTVGGVREFVQVSGLLNELTIVDFVVKIGLGKEVKFEKTNLKFKTNADKA